LSEVTAAIREALDAGLNPQALDLARRARSDSDSARLGSAQSVSTQSVSARSVATDVAEIRYLGALASARMGAIDEAEKWLAEVDRASLADGPLGVEVWSLSGRIAKERYAATRDRTSRAAIDLARTAIDGYRHAFDLGRAAYPAVNAATIAALSGDSALARELALEALNAANAGGDHWHHATAGEALLLLGRPHEARARYAEAWRLAGNRFGDLASMRRQLLLIGSDVACEIAGMLPVPQVIAFSGHMIDHPDRPSPRFPAHVEPLVAGALRAKIAALGPAIGYAQAACGADILFLEAMQDAGHQTQIVLPFASEHFIATSVRFAGDAWVERFQRALARATRVILATEEPFLGDDVLFEHAANLIQGMAFLRAGEFSAQPLMLTVRERNTPELVGGTVATARTWARKGGQVDNIDLTALRGAGSMALHGDAGVANNVQSQFKAGAAVSTSQARTRSLKSLLFADISGYTRMPEQYTPDFAEMFLGNCKAILDSLEHPAVGVNTYGDGLFAVFELPSHAAEFAVRLQRELGHVDWPALGLAPETGARIGLHTGPVFRVFDAVMGRNTFYGTHVNRTARLEPIVQPRHIFVTEEFAASLVADDQDRFRCDYIGAVPLAKHFGNARLYRLRQMTEN
jgi:Adenylate and Guanylate cyclase catalytic domain